MAKNILQHSVCKKSWLVILGLRPFEAVFQYTRNHLPEIRSESELFTGDTSKDNNSPGPVIRRANP